MQECGDGEAAVEMFHFRGFPDGPLQAKHRAAFLIRNYNFAGRSLRSRFICTFKAEMQGLELSPTRFNKLTKKNKNKLAFV